MAAPSPWTVRGQGGATFTVQLPVGDTGAVIEPAESASHGPAGLACSVLVVDDESDIRDMLADILRSPNRSIVTARSGREALECMEAAWYDVILTDIRMPDLDGPSLHREIERRWPDRTGRIVFVTGDTLNSSLEEFAFNSGRPVIEKPFLPGEVRRIVAEVAAGAARVSSAPRQGG